MSKPADIAGYTISRTERVEQVLLEIWSRLTDYHDHLVLVGGLAPRYLVPQISDRVPPYCGTLNVDLAVSLVAADVRAYAGIRETLEHAGLRPGTNARGNEQRHSFVMEDDAGPVIVDFLTTRYDGPPEVVRAVEHQLSAIQVDGLGLALADPQLVTLKGRALRGGILKTTLRVCRPVPFVVLKALAFDRRREPKDAHDLVYVLQWVADGPQRVAAMVTDEERGANAFTNAIESLQGNFESPAHDGPVRYGHFLGGKSDAEIQAFAAVQEFLACFR